VSNPGLIVIRDVFIEWVDAEKAYWLHVQGLPVRDGEEPDFGPFYRWKTAQARAHAIRESIGEPDE
jgi:hypothetical protein